MLYKLINSKNQDFRKQEIKSDFQIGRIICFTNPQCLAVIKFEDYILKESDGMDQW